MVAFNELCRGNHERVVSVQQAEEALAFWSVSSWDGNFPLQFESAHPLHDTQGHLQNLIIALENPAYVDGAPLVNEQAEAIIRLLAEFDYRPSYR